MSCCFGSKDPESNEQDDSPVVQPKGNPNSMSTMTSGPFSQTVNKNLEGRASAATTTAPATINTHEAMDNLARNFGFREVAMATKNFRRECLLGESAFGKVYKGTLQGSGQVVAVKQLDRHGTKANKEFLVEVMRLSHLKHPNLAQLIGYCADGDQRILVYEYMQSGGLKAHLHEVPPERKPLDWITRMKVASGSAEAIEYLHEKANPPILYRNFKSSNIMLDENFNPKLTDYGLLRLQIDSGNTMQQRIVGTVGCAPEYEQNGELTPKSDVYSFGIVLLELITGRKALDTDRPVDEQNVVTWAQPYFKEPKRFPEMADPQLQGAFPERSLNQAVGVAAMCVQEEPSVRPLISDVVAALSFLTVAPPSPKTHPTPASTHNPDEKTRSPSSSREVEQEREASSSHNDGTEETSYTDSDEEYEQRPIGNNNNKPEYGEDGDVSWSSESLYNEDDYGEDESQPEETSYRVKSKPKSIKRKVTFQTESRNGSRNSSKGSTKSFKTHSNLRKKSVNRKSSRNKTVDESVSKKSHEVLKDDQSSSNSNQSNNKSRSRRNSKSNMHSSSRRSKSKKIVIVESSDSSFSSSSDESNRRIVTFD